MERRDGKSQHHPIPDPVENMELMERIWDLKSQFWTFREIAEEVGLAHKTVQKYFHRYELFRVPVNVEQERLMHLQQLEEMIARAHRLLKRAPDVETELKILAEIRAWMKDQRHFLGLNSETKLRVKNVNTTEMDENISGLLKEFGMDFEEEESLADKRRDERRARFRE